MKASLRSKILILSLASLAVIGTGCERRGRAPDKAIDAPNVETTIDNVKTKTETALDKKTETSSPIGASKDLKSMIATAALSGKGCAISIDASEAPTAESYGKDYASVISLYKCEGENGVFLSHDDVKDANGKILSRAWKVDANAKTDPGASPSKMLAEFLRLAALSNDDDAQKILSARMDLFQAYVNIMNTKYGDHRLDEKTEFTLKSDKGDVLGTVGAAQNDLNQMSSVVETARDQLKDMKSVVKGAEVTLSTSAE